MRPVVMTIMSPDVATCPLGAEPPCGEPGPSGWKDLSSGRRRRHGELSPEGRLPGPAPPQSRRLKVTVFQPGVTGEAWCQCGPGSDQHLTKHSSTTFMQTQDSSHGVGVDAEEQGLGWELGAEWAQLQALPVLASGGCREATGTLPDPVPSSGKWAESLPPPRPMSMDRQRGACAGHLAGPCGKQRDLGTAA